jgi:hypothetical protein
MAIVHLPLHLQTTKSYVLLPIFEKLLKCTWNFSFDSKQESDESG